MIVLAMAERAHVPGLSARAEARYARGWVPWAKHALVWPGPTARRWEGLLAGNKVSWVCNLLPPAREIGTWDAVLAREYAGHVLRWAAGQQGPHGIDEPAQLILLGRRVDRAFQGEWLHQPPAPWGKVFTITHGAGTTRCLVVPHPSGRNRAYNDPKLRSRVQWALAHFCAEVK